MENLGGDKVYRILSSHLPENLRIGRKSTYDLMRVHGLIRHKRCKHVKTTYTVYKLEYHDLIKRSCHRSSEHGLGCWYHIYQDNIGSFCLFGTGDRFLFSKNNRLEPVWTTYSGWCDVRLEGSLADTWRGRKAHTSLGQRMSVLQQTIHGTAQVAEYPNQYVYRRRP